MKTLVEWFQAVTNMLQPLRHAHPGACLGEGHCAMPPPIFGPRHKSAKYALKSRNQILVKHACGRGIGGHKSVNRSSVSNKANFFINSLIR